MIHIKSLCPASVFHAVCKVCGWVAHFPLWDTPEARQQDPVISSSRSPLSLDRLCELCRWKQSFLTRACSLLLPKKKLLDKSNKLSQVKLQRNVSKAEGVWVTVWPRSAALTGVFVYLCHVHWVYTGLHPEQQRTAVLYQLRCSITCCQTSYLHSVKMNLACEKASFLSVHLCGHSVVQLTDTCQQFMGRRRLGWVIQACCVCLLMRTETQVL